MASPPRNQTSIHTLFILLNGQMVTIHEEQAKLARRTIIDRPVNVTDPLCQMVTNAINGCGMAALMLALLNQHLQKGDISGGK